MLQHSIDRLGTELVTVDGACAIQPRQLPAVFDRMGRILEIDVALRSCASALAVKREAIGPGSIRLTWMPLPCSSIRMVMLSPSSANFEAV